MEKLLLSGEPGVGKSTVLSKLYEKYPLQIVGVIARDLRDAQNGRLGFSSGPLDNPTLLTIAHVTNTSTSRVGKYGVDLQALDSVADLLASQLDVAQKEAKVLIFDEVGLMQSYSEKLRKQIENVLKSNVPVVMAIKQDDSSSEWLKSIKTMQVTRLITITEESRDEVLNELSRYIDEYTLVKNKP